MKLIFFLTFSIINVEMKKVKAFLHTLLSSLIPQSHYYKTLLHARFTTSLRFYLLLHLLAAFIAVTLIFLKVNPISLFKLRQSVVSSVYEIPTDSRITLRNGELSSSFFRPFLFWVSLPSRRTLFLVIDERASADKILEYGSKILLTKKHLVFTVRNRVIALPYTSLFPDMSVDKYTLNNLIETQFNRLTWTINLMLPFFYLIIALIHFFGWTLTNVIASLIVHTLFQITGKKYHYLKILQTAFHSSSLPVIIVLFMSYLSRFSSTHILAAFLLSTIFLTAGVYEAHYRESHHLNRHRSSKTGA